MPERQQWRVRDLESRHGRVRFLRYQRWSSNRVAAAFFGRYDELKHDTAFVPGFGIFVTESGAPLKIQGGFTIEAIDHKARLGLQVGFPF